MTTLKIDSSSNEDIAEFLNILCDEVFHKPLRDLKTEILKKPANAVMKIDDVMRLCDHYDVKYEFKVQYTKTAFKRSELKPIEIAEPNVGFTESLVEKNMNSQEKEIINPEVKEIVEKAKTEDKVAEAPKNFGSLPPPIF